MSQGPVPPRYPPQNPYQPQQPAPQMPQQPMSPPPIQQPQMPAYPQAEQDGFLVDVPGQPPVQHSSAQPIPYYTPMAQHSGGVWNQNGILVMHKQAQLPPQCIKCCAPIEGKPLKRNVTWHSSWVYILLILGGPLIYAIVALSIQEKATIHVPLCDKHRGKRRMHLWLATGIFFASIACFFLAANARRNGEATWSMIGLLLFITSLIYAALNSRLVVTPTKIDAQYAWLKGASPQFVGQFPSMQ